MNIYCYVLPSAQHPLPFPGGPPCSSRESYCVLTCLYTLHHSAPVQESPRDQSLIHYILLSKQPQRFQLELEKWDKWWIAKSRGTWQPHLLLPGRPPAGAETEAKNQEIERRKALISVVPGPVCTLPFLQTGCLALPLITQDIPISFPKSPNIKYLPPPHHNSTLEMPTIASDCQPNPL